MWITAWILVAAASQNQPYLPPFATQAECEQARKAYLSVNRADSSATCIQAKVFANAQR